eukprot:381122_1
MATENINNNKKKTALELFPKLKTIVSQWTSCADCNDTHPKWAEITRGILICLQCSGVHRSLGTHVSKVRSITLDNWTQKMVNNMCESNIKFNKIWEYHVDKQYIKPSHKTRRDIRTKYIKYKYIGIQDYKITNKLIPTFHIDQYGPLLPVYASEKYDKDYNKNINNNKEEKDGEENENENVGMIEYTGVIQIHVICANDLPKADLFSDSDPYVIFNNTNGQSVKTKVIDDNNDPKWNQHLVLSVHENQPITITIYDEDDHSKDDLLCKNILHIGKQCKDGKETKFHMAMQVDKKYKKQKKNSTLTFTVTYNKMDAQ